jgi:glyoxylase-like metal-dependent hydrolase (beta-lactamase superfamily II)
MSTATIHLPASEPLPLDFAPDLHVRSFLLERAEENILVYAARPPAPGHIDFDRQYLTHWHEAWAAGGVAEHARLLVHEAERDATERYAKVWHTFSRRHHLGDDFEVIPAPGHTPGSTFYLWDDGAHRHLFTGDTVYLVDGEWRAAVLESSDPAAYAETLELIKTLDFDVLVPWAASAGDPPYAVTDRADTARRIDAILARMRAGEDR